jgi:hypothetical protein
MALNDQKKADAFAAALEGIPRVVELITAVPLEKRPAAVAAALQVYVQTARKLGYEETEAQQWASEIIRILENRIWLKFISSLNSMKPKIAGGIT